MSEQRELYATPPSNGESEPEKNDARCSCPNGTTTITRDDRCKTCGGRPRFVPGTVTVLEE